MAFGDVFWAFSAGVAVPSLACVLGLLTGVARVSCALVWHLPSRRTDPRLGTSFSLSPGPEVAVTWGQVPGCE